MPKKKIAVLTGAGVSAESGLATFRGSGGLWGEYDPQEVASIEGWYRNRELVLGFYNQLRVQLSQSKPNAAHLAIAGLEKDYDVTVITQNVDNLHERAGSTRVIHLHGEATKVRPEDGVYDRTYSEKEVIDVGYEPVNIGDLAPNGSQLRPHIVFFGEAVPKIEKAIDVVADADIRRPGCTATPSPVLRFILSTRRMWLFTIRRSPISGRSPLKVWRYS